MLDFRRFEVITFDCYGTLIDWETGLLDALRPMRERAPIKATDQEILATYASLESTLESGDYISYRDVLRGVMRGLAERLEVPHNQVDVDALGASLGHWPPFPDTINSLRRLKRHCRLAILSNIDNELFAKTSRQLAIPFDWVITAEQARSYKPSPNNFEKAAATMKLPKDRILHAAQSRFHDIAPARALGITCVWVNRRHDKDGEGPTAPSNAQPDLEVPDLKTLADLVDAA